ncbi:MAG: (Fe-S)-binding protein [bacterium]|nr:(Fe-S)-binding protein [bacterium]
MKVRLFVPCFMDQFFPDSVWKAVQLLKQANCDVVFEEKALCCGQPAFNSGYRKDAYEVAKPLIDLLTMTNEPIVVLSGSCCSMIKIHYHELHLPPELEQQWVKWKNRVFEFCDFWVNVLQNPTLPNSFKSPLRVLFHRSCHALRELKIVSAAETLLQQIPNLELVYTNDFDACCGFGGTFAVKFPEISISMADSKLDYAMQHKVDGIASLDMSCLMHLQARSQKRFLPLKFWYAPELLIYQ